MQSTVLGIETSCDETAVALYDARRGLLGHRVYSQVALHARYGGVVPELASRDHIRKILPLIEDAMSAAGTTPTDLSAVAYTAGPGLIGALLVGATTAVGLAMAWNRPAIAVHHLEAHLLAPMLEDVPPQFPFVALLVSGGHTMLIDVQAFGRYRILGETLDDAAGEAFDKTAKLLGLPYPGGPELAALAVDGNPAAFDLPRPMLKKPGLDFSFSGLKTAVMLKVREAEGRMALTESMRADLAASFQQAVVDTLVAKSLRAVKQSNAKTLVIAGGVGANRQLRQSMSQAMQSIGVAVCYPRIEFCTDNAAMVAYTGSRHFERDHALMLAKADLTVHARARWNLEDI